MRIRRAADCRNKRLAAELAGPLTAADVRWREISPAPPEGRLRR
jgi:hypothetical protein